MNIIIPIKAYSSTSSRSRLARGSASVKTSKANRKRHIFSVLSGTFLAGAVIIGSFSASMNNVAASDTFPTDPLMLTANPGRTLERGNPVTTVVTPVLTAPVAPISAGAPTSPDAIPVPTTTVLPVPPAVTPALPVAATASPAQTFAPVVMSAEQPPQTVTSHSAAPAVKPVVTTAPAAYRTQPLVAQSAVLTQPVEQQLVPQPFDTSAEIANLTAAEARNNPQSVSYSSGRLSGETRNRLFILAIIATLTGILLYRISIVSYAAASKRQLAPIPVQETRSN